MNQEDNTPLLAETETLSIRDQHGNEWIAFTVDPFDGRNDGICEGCGSRIVNGYLLLDGGEEWCDNCIVLFADEDAEVSEEGNVVRYKYTSEIDGCEVYMIHVYHIGEAGFLSFLYALYCTEASGNPTKEPPI